MDNLFTVHDRYAIWFAKKMGAFCIRTPNYAMRSHTVNSYSVFSDPEWIP